MASGKTTKKLHNDCSDVFRGIGCFRGTISLQVRDYMKPYQVLPLCIACALQAFK